MMRLLESKLILFQGKCICWSKTIPLKVWCFIWRASLDRIHVADALAIRGVDTPNSICSLFNKETETIDRLLITCEYSVREFIDFVDAWGNYPKKISILSMVFNFLIWNIWRARNDKTFKKIGVSPTKTGDIIISLSYVWYKYKCNLGCGVLVDWCISPFNHFPSYSSCSYFFFSCFLFLFFLFPLCIVTLASFNFLLMGAFYVICRYEKKSSLYTLGYYCI